MQDTSNILNILENHVVATHAQFTSFGANHTKLTRPCECKELLVPYDKQGLGGQLGVIEKQQQVHVLSR